MGSLHRTGGVLAVGAIRRALVEDQGDVGAELRLDLHRSLRREELLGAVDVGAEADALLADLEDAAVERRPAAPPLDSRRRRSPCASEKTWKPPESVMIAPSQPMN